jgi:hypothetical protein
MKEREQEVTTVAERVRREPEPPAPLRAGTREWASAVGSAAVARMARQRMVAREEAEELEEPEAQDGEAPPEAEDLGALDELPEDSLPE